MTRMPGVEWVAHVETDPIRALESFVTGWFPAERPEVGEGTSGADGLGDMPAALTALHRFAGARPALHEFHHPLWTRPERASGPLGDRLVFANENQAGWDWSVPWPPHATDKADPPVWLTFDPRLPDPETIVEEEPLSRFLLQFTLFGASGAAPYQAWTNVVPTERLAPLGDMLRPVPLSPFLPTFTAERFFVAPGLLAQISSGEGEATVAFGALRRETLTPLREHPFPWRRFDG
ncbi:hypothetical protein [Embleya sp. NBC_00896]|uniref:hypothetical protein n=1 Tax=Embleya sp. NBC_00896 TaxID=2975961 RepID=UPI00386CCAFD|nr:hypothetical protein OG928_47370 [Embleya sp. NBC_00896]